MLMPPKDGRLPDLLDCEEEASSTVPTTTTSTPCARPMATAFVASKLLGFTLESSVRTLPISCVECTISACIAFEMEVATSPELEPVLSANGNTPTLNCA